ncbi:high affinity cationic amino acid transporter 1 [Nematostella vectensis]|uniref:high affinity cationic amino acid transporter 1 n=1 Tax=Nematostella vectensis TaxID=45351 RepID=UPI0013901E0E|nr:high affinity cationic amino acid transporter 1 [Nematostella vectensis]XP_032238639.1 high affinity cationic amino acid transporter 1 [Nematostella vectensis]
MPTCPRVCFNLLRRKGQDFGPSDSPLRRCLNTFDLTSLGVGTVVGAGLYVVTGELARDVAGPAVVISFFIAAVAALLSGLCYAEFGSRIPKAGSAYVYTYVTLGELLAFIVGWNMILEYLIASATLARSCSEYINAISGGAIYKFFMSDIATWHVKALGPFPDFLALAIATIITIIVCFGVKHSAWFNKITLLVNMAVIVFTICVGLYFIDTSNWSTPKKFAPYGVGGVLTAAGSCFYAFVGFDAIATAGEEAIDPKRSLPQSIILSLAVSFLAYFGVATILTLIIPYQNLSHFAPLAEAFVSRGFPAAKYVISVGALCATSCCLMCNSFAAPRVVYSMASDGLLFRFFAHVNDRTHVPVRAALADYVVIGTLAVLLDIRQLVEMLSIGTLVAYSMVALAVLLTRYQVGVPSVTYSDDTSKQRTRVWLKKMCCQKEQDEPPTDYQGLTESSVEDKEESLSSLDPKSEPTDNTSCRASIATTALVLGILGMCLTMTLAFPGLNSKRAWAIFLACLFGLVIIVALMVLERQPKNNATFPFMVPACPYLPALTVFVNVLLIVKLDYMTYIRFGCWLALGLLIYALYGYRHSIEGLKQDDNPTQYIIPQTPPIQQIVEEQHFEE